MIIIGPLALILILFILFAILNKGAAEKKMRLEFESFQSRFERENGQPLRYSFAEFWQFASGYLARFRLARAMAALIFLIPLIFLWLGSEAGKGWDRNETLAMVYHVMAGLFIILGFVAALWVQNKFGKGKFAELIAKFEATISS
ncbi:MAG: hypothetical protein HLUCCA04_04875 [Oceanicaulis sp. HLUCCA04]|nr:MAG: hypothetical protein HLUCCA04_04875 [Oceanicaulis sp. HLUCCA04]